MENNISISAGSVTLDGKMEFQGESRGVVITHPHPLYGGSMNNNVVGSLQRAFRSAGYATLRINFRGVGQSSGDFDEGIGEQEDVLSALSFFKNQGVSSLALAGYSFGAWVNSKISSPEGLFLSVWVSPPIAFLDMPLDQIKLLPGLIVAGDRDDLCPLPTLKTLVSQLAPPPAFEILPGTDHFFWGKEHVLEEKIKEFLIQLPG